jgi:hypothetical protein
MRRGRRQHRAKKIVRHYRGVMGLGDGRDLFAVGQPAGQTEIRPHILAAAIRQEFAEFPNGVQAFAIGNGGGDSPSNFRLRDDAVDLDRVFDSQRSKFGDDLDHRKALQRGEFAMQFDQQVSVLARRITRGGHSRLDGAHQCLQ